MGARVLLIRHGETPWNKARRLQGRADIELSEAARKRLAASRLPARLVPVDWFASPLKRATETARLLGAERVRIAPRLIEMDLGDWEGRTLAELRARDPGAMAANEARGLDLRPPGGESPRDVQERVRSWLAERAERDDLTVGVTHKGVIRAVLALALNWDMTDEPPVRLDWRAAHLFRLARDGSPAAEQPNIILCSR